MTEKYRIIRCDDNELAAIDKEDIIGVRRGKFCNEILTENSEKYPNLTADRASIEEIMVYYVKEGA